MSRPLSLIALLLLAVPAAAQEHGLKVPPGFKVTLYSDQALANDIYSMTLDDQGSVLVSSRGWVKRLVDADGDGKADKADVIYETKSGAMGMCWDRGWLYLTADGYFSRVKLDGEGARAPENIVPLVFNEHGVHAIRKGPDGRFYVVGGNDAGIQKLKLAESSPIKKVEGGGILRFSRDLKSVECIAHGFRNPYDFDFTPLGDIITYDSDTERDYLLPWYSPTRIYHVAYGQHHGWRLPGYMRSLARPDYYPDTVDILAPVGRGSPTGVACYRHVQLPSRYHGGVFACDWTFGKIWFLPLEPSGSTYRTKPEVFLEPVGGSGFAPTDICVAPDGSLFVSIGGRGTRGAVYRITYVGTEDEPAGTAAKPKEDIDVVLNAPQPLDAWSRARWEPAAKRLGEAELAKAFVDEERPIAKRIRAIEAINDVHGGLSAEAAQMFGRKLMPTGPKGEGEHGSKAVPPAVVARFAWSVARDPVANGEHLLTLAAYVKAGPQEAHARAAVLDALARAFSAKQYPARFLSRVALIASDHAGDPDKRVRLALMPLFAAVNRLDPDNSAIPGELSEREIRAELTRLIARFHTGSADGTFTVSDYQAAYQALLTSDRPLHVDALRLLMLVDGDWCLDNPPQEVASAYVLQKPARRRPLLENKLRERIRQLYPSGDRHFDIEASRYFAMIEDDDPQTLAKVQSRITPESDPTDDLHHLIVLSRLKAKPAEADTHKVVGALLGLEKKFAGKQLRIKQNFGPRMEEIAFNLLTRYPKMSQSLLEHPSFVHPAHVVFATNFSTENRVKAAGLFLAAVRKDANFQWSPELVNLLAELPPEEARPEFRKQWSEYALREVILKQLLKQPVEEDRQRFLDGLESTNRQTVLACVRALATLPRDESSKNMVPLLRRAVGSGDDAKEADLRASLLKLLARQEALEAPYPTAQTAVEMFERKHPAEAKLLRGDDEDAEAWKKTLGTVNWDSGNVERGLKLFNARSCTACHTGGTRVGPDLTGATGRFSRDDLFTAIISPSRDVAPAFRVNEIETQDGKNYSGIVVFESADGVIVQLDAVNTVRIDNGNILSRQPSRKSLMPSGLLKDLKPDDLADLYAYLKSLK